MGNATEWINTDERSVLNDISRLGLDGATDYQMELIAERTQDGDDRWAGITRDDMRAEIGRLNQAIEDDVADSWAGEYDDD